MSFVEFVDYLLFLFVWPMVFSAIILRAYKRIFKNKLKTDAYGDGDPQEIVALRKKMLRRRTIRFVVFFSLCFLFLLAVGVFQFLNSKIFYCWQGQYITKYDYKHLACSYITIIIVLIRLRNEFSLKDLFGNISCENIDSFVQKNERFILYLRGFDCDVPYGKESRNDTHVFNEALFVETVEYALGVPICALGMTKEIDSPLGATRVYVTDDNWKASVLKLMNCAEKIVILVNDRESCVWEIDQSKTLLDKTIFVVDDLKKYSAVRNHFAGNIDMPEILDVTKVPFFFSCGKPFKEFKNNKKGYLSILGFNPKVFEESKDAERKTQWHAKIKENAMNDLFIVMGIVGVLMILTVVTILLFMFFDWIL